MKPVCQSYNRIKGHFGCFYNSNHTLRRALTNQQLIPLHKQNSSNVQNYSLQRILKWNYHCKPSIPIRDQFSYFMLDSNKCILYLQAEIAICKYMAYWCKTAFDTALLTAQDLTHRNLLHETLDWKANDYSNDKLHYWVNLMLRIGHRRTAFYFFHSHVVTIGELSTAAY